VALAIVAGVLKIAAAIRGSTIMQLLRTDTLWPLAIILPSFLFGKVLGLMAMNLIGYFTPLRRVFERECLDTGRNLFATVTAGLVRVALVLFVLAAVGTVVFLSYSP
jgi:heme/copper-type cytochrome/quinol oxidase subunit 1